MILLFDYVEASRLEIKKYLLICLAMYYVDFVSLFVKLAI